jgi:hypothetical protein
MPVDTSTISGAITGVLLPIAAIGLAVIGVLLAARVFLWLRAMTGDAESEMVAYGGHDGSAMRHPATGYYSDGDFDPDDDYECDQCGYIFNEDSLGHAVDDTGVCPKCGNDIGLD